MKPLPGEPALSGSPRNGHRSRAGLYTVFAIVVVVVVALALWRLRPSPAAASFERGRQLQAVQMNREARDAYEQATRVDPAFAPPYRALAELAASYGQYDVAAQYWKDYIKRDPAGRHALCQLARVEVYLGLELPALDHAEQEMKRDPRCPRANLIAGILYTRKSEPKRALEHLAVAAKAYPDDVRVLLSYARVLSLTGDYDTADSVLQRIVQRDRSHAEPYYWLGYINARHPATPATLANAEKFLMTALDLQPDYPDANFELARLYFGQRQAARALPFALRAAVRRKHHPAGLYLLADVYQSVGRTSDAEAVRKQFQHESELAGQEKALIKRYRLNNNDIETALTLGKVEIEREKPEAALLFLRDAARLAPADARIAAAIKEAEAMLAAQAASAPAGGALPSSTENQP